MTIEEIKLLIEKDEHRTLELKKTTGELKDGIQSACAFLNTEGGWLIFGVTPSSLKISGQIVTDNTQREIAQALAGLEPTVDVRAEYIDIPESGGKQLIAIHFDAWKEGQIPYTYQGRPYYRVESTTKVMPREIYDERLRSSNPQKHAWEEQLANGISLPDLSEERIRNAVRGGIAGGRINTSAENDSVESILEKFKLLKDGKVTNAAVVLFGKKLYDYPQLMLRMAYFRGKDKMAFIDNKQEEGNFFDLLDAGIAFCFRHLSLSGEVKGLVREEHLEIPLEALREALTNALCHRRYDDPRTLVTLAIYDDRLEITNPGRFPAPLTPESIKKPHGSYPYNLRIAQVLYQSTNLESWGSGVSRMVDLCKEHGLPEPEYTTDGYTVKIVFWKAAKKDESTTQKTTQKEDNTTQKTTQKEDNTTQKTTQKEDNTTQKRSLEVLNSKKIKLTDSQISILSQIAQMPTITRKELEKVNSEMSKDGIKYIIARLQELGFLHREGGRKNGKWVVTIDEEESL